MDIGYYIREQIVAAERVLFNNETSELLTLVVG
jgi:hypothetical protein